MRDPNRLYKFYDKLCELHMEYVPDWRFGQLITNFISDLKTDPFYMEEDEFFEKLEKFVISSCYNPR